jgi:hypothetical protein
LRLSEGFSRSLLEKPLRVGYGQRLVEKGKVPAEVVLFEMGEQDVGLAGPRSDHAGDSCETPVAGLLEQFLQDSQASVPAGVNDVVGFARSLGDHERLAETVRPNRGLDAVVFRVGRTPGIVFVRVDPGDVEGHELQDVTGCLAGVGVMPSRLAGHGRSSATMRYGSSRSKISG